MNYHKAKKMKKPWQVIRSDHSHSRPGQDSRGNPIPYGRLPGNDQDRFYSQSELYLVTVCNCELCTKFWLENYGIKPDQAYESGEYLLELTSDEKFLTYQFMGRGYANVPRAKGLTRILRALQADTKGPWTKRPFWFNGRMVKPGHWKIEKFDRLSRKEISLTRPVVKVQKHALDYDDKIDFESRAQMNAEFEKRFSQ